MFHRSGHRGQAMVEFAIILPVLALLLVLSVDFGRVFFGWAALQNAARIGANHAAMHPDAWEAPGIAALKQQYRDEVLRDMQAINCSPPGGATWAAADVPDPTFVDRGGTADPYELGDHASVALGCRFTFITPLVSMLLGNPITINADADFAVRGGVISGVPIGPAPPPPPSCVDAIVPNMVGMSVSGARSAWTAAGFTGAFTPATGQDTETVLSQVTNPASSVGDCIPRASTVTVTSAPPGACPAPDLAVPNLVGLTVANARTTWTGAGFTGSFTPASGSDTNQVDSQSLTPASCQPPSAAITVTHSVPPPPPPPTCTAPELLGKKVSQAQTAFTVAGFTGAVNVTRPPNNDYVVEVQSLVGGQPYPCSSSITVGPKP